MSSHPNDAGFTLTEVIIAGAILIVALAMIGNYLIGAGRSVAASTAHQDDNAAAQGALDRLENNIRFACNMFISGSTLYVANASGTCSTPGQPSCAEWASSGGSLDETTSSGTSVIVRGVSGLSFTGNSAYNGLVTIQFNLRQPQDQASDPSGVSVNQTLTARNMSQSILAGAVCTP